jgi:hypothetical protein
MLVFRKSWSSGRVELGFSAVLAALTMVLIVAFGFGSTPRTAAETPPQTSPDLLVSISPSSNGPLELGQSVTYTFTVKNIGNRTLYRVWLNGCCSHGKYWLNGDSDDPDIVAQLAPGASFTQSASSTVKQTEMDRGTVLTEGRVSAEDAAGYPIASTYTTLELGTNQQSGLSLTVQRTQTGPVSVAQFVDYSFVVKNTGSLTLRSITLSDPILRTVSCPVSELAGGASVTCTRHYGVTYDDQFNGSVVRQLTVTGETTTGADVEAHASDTIAVTQPYASATAFINYTTVNIALPVKYQVWKYPANSTVTISWIRTSGQIVPLTTVQTNSAGNARGEIDVPLTPSGASGFLFASGQTKSTAPVTVAPRFRAAVTDVAVGDSLILYLRGFSAGESVRIRWNDNGTWRTLTTVTTSSTGDSSPTIVVPSWAKPGAASIRADGTVNRLQTNAVTVRGPRYSPTANVYGDAFTVDSTLTYQLKGYPENSAVQITWVRSTGATVSLGTIQTDSTGQVAGQLTVPAAPAGTNQLRFSSGQCTAQDSFTINPRMRLSPTATGRGQTVNVSLRGFSVGETVNIRWKKGNGWQIVATVRTSSSGSANAYVTVPSWVPDGATSVRADGTVYRLQTNAVTVSGGAFAPADVATPTPTATPQPSPTTTPTATPTVTPTPEATPSATASPTETATSEPSPTETATPEPTEPVTPVPTETPIPDATPVTG